MKNLKILPISIATILLAAFSFTSFFLYDASESIAIRGIKGSYAEAYAKDNKIEFIAIADSENENAVIPSAKNDENSTDKADSEKEEAAEKITKKENDLFSYNYEDKAVSITAYKGGPGEIIIPETIDNLPVKSIEMQIIGNDITVVEIPESVISVKAEFTSPRYTSEFFTVLAIMVLGYLFAVASTLIGFRKAKTSEETFYGVPFVYSGMVTYVFITVWCAVALFFGFSPILQILAAGIIFAAAAVKLLKKSAARELITERTAQIRQQTALIKMLTADADSLMAESKNNDIKAETKRVYEAIRYSDPISNDALADIEKQIQNAFNAFANAVKNTDVDLAKTSADELIILINDRNKKCKLLK